jgi:pyruvate dehydrogenase E2 component (dihydrolipoamide acetyltransferase)
VTATVTGAEIVMPRLSDSMEEGTVLKWLKSVGDEVAVGEELVEIETDKANMVYEADAAGTLIEIVAAEGESLPVGEVIARVGQGSETAGNRATSRVKASPIARRIAKEHGFELTAVEGTGPGGRVLKADVEAALASGSVSTPTLSPPVRTESAFPPAPEGSSAPSPAQAGVASSPGITKAPPAPLPAPAGPTPGVSEKPETAKGQVEVVELTKLQQTVARRMAESKATAPHFYLQAEIDMTAAVEGRAKLKASAKEGEVVPTFNDMVVKACALALREHPRANGAYRDGQIELYSRINVGVAVAAQDALVVPTVFDADQKGLRRIASETRALASRVRDGQITPPELSGGTFTVSNLGMYGISNFHAVINTPQAGILAVGELKAKPVIREGARQRDPFNEVGEIVPRQMMGVTLACDHRILYGADGAQFLARARELLESPLGLAL